MKKYVLRTTSDSYDTYTYFIMSKKEPTHRQISKFLLEYGSDKDDEEGISYEQIYDIEEITDDKFIII